MRSRRTFLLPSVTDAIFLGIFYVLVLRAGGAELLNDGDTGHHIRAGEIILDQRTVPREDIFSFITPRLQWTAHAWLSETLMAVIYRSWGITGIVICFASIIALIYALLFRMLLKNSRDLLLALIVTVFVVISSTLHWLARPHIFSLLFTVICCHILGEFQYRNRNLLYLLPPIMLLWVNLHGGFIVGFILIGIYWVGNLAGSLLAGANDEQWKKLRLLGAVLMICLLVSLVNPRGYHILLFPFKVTFDSFVTDNIIEYMSPNFHDSVPFKYLFLAFIATLAVSRIALNRIELMVVLLFTYMALYSVRHIPLFALVVAPIWLKLIVAVSGNVRFSGVSKLQERSRKLAQTEKTVLCGAWSILGLLLVIILAGLGIITFRFSPDRFPTAAVEFMKREKIAGNMFNTDQFGDYIIFAAWPQYRVFVDGRSDMYGARYMREYFNVARVEPGWEQTLSGHNITWVITGSESTLSTVLKDRGKWVQIYGDRVANIFVKNVPEHRKLIDRYGGVTSSPVQESKNH